MIKEVKLTGLDGAQIPRYVYNEDTNSIRVEVVNGEDPFSITRNINVVPSSTPVIEQKFTEVPVIVKEVQLERVEVPVIVREVQIERIEVPVITVQKEVQIVQIEKPIIVTEYKEIQVPVIQVQKEIVYVDKINYKFLYIMQGITLALIILSKFIK